MRILVVGGGIANRPDVQAVLHASAADIVADAEEAVEFARAYDYSAIFSGASLRAIRAIRSAGLRLPLIAFAGAENEASMAEAYRAGADDVVDARCHEELLRARILAVVRRSNGHDSAIVQLGSLTVDMQARQVTIENGRRVPLTIKEYKILEAMLLRRGHIIRKEQFLSALYCGRDEPEIKIIDVLVCKLRKKLVAVGADGVVRTVWGQGYMVLAPGAAAAALN